MVVSQRIPDEAVQDVLLRADIVDVIGDYVQLKKSGTNYKGLCPFHSEKTPSFTVSSTKGLFYCFGCQASGNVMRFLMRHEGLNFPEAVRWLAARYGMRLPASGTESQADSLNPLYTLHRAATAFFHHCLRRDPAAHAGRMYCRQRQLTGEVVTRFELGYAPDAWEILCQSLKQQGFSQEVLTQSGLVVVREPQQRMYDRFRHRLMFPIHDRLGRPVAFGGRALEGNDTAHVPKYLNSPETPIFHKSRLLYGFHLAKHAIRQHEQAIIVEGYTDVLACHRQGITSAVGTLGTALTEHHVALLKGMAKEVILVFDSDAAGNAASERSIGLFLEAGMRVRVAELPAGEDPDSFLRQHTAADFQHYIHTAMTFVEFLLARAQRYFDLSTPAGQADCAARILPLLHRIDNQVERWGYVAQVADRVGVPPEVLQRQMSSQAVTQPVSPRPASQPTTSRPVGRRSNLPPRVPKHPPAEEYALLHLLCHDPRWLEHVQQHVTAEHFQDPTLGELYTLILQINPSETNTVFSQLAQHPLPPLQEQLLAKMSVTELLSDAAARPKVLHEYLTKMRRRNLRLQQQQVREQLTTAHDTAEQQRLLQECARLGKEIQTEYAH